MVHIWIKCHNKSKSLLQHVNMYKWLDMCGPTYVLVCAWANHCMLFVAPWHVRIRMEWWSGCAAASFVCMAWMGHGTCISRYFYIEISGDPQHYKLCGHDFLFSSCASDGLHSAHIVSWEPEGRYCRSKMIRWEPEGRYRLRLCTAIAPFWFSTDRLWIAITPFWLSTDDIVSWEQDGRYHYSTMFCWELEGHYRWTKSMAIAPFWFLKEQHYCPSGSPPTIHCISM